MSHIIHQFNACRAGISADLVQQETLAMTYTTTKSSSFPAKLQHCHFVSSSNMPNARSLRLRPLEKQPMLPFGESPFPYWYLRHIPPLSQIVLLLLCSSVDCLVLQSWLRGHLGALKDGSLVPCLATTDQKGAHCCPTHLLVSSGLEHRKETGTYQEHAI